MPLYNRNGALDPFRKRYMVLNDKEYYLFDPQSGQVEHRENNNLKPRCDHYRSGMVFEKRNELFVQVGGYRSGQPTHYGIWTCQADRLKWEPFDVQKELVKEGSYGVFWHGGIGAIMAIGTKEYRVWILDYKNREWVEVPWDGPTRTANKMKFYYVRSQNVVMGFGTRKVWILKLIKTKP